MYPINVNSQTCYENLRQLSYGDGGRGGLYE